MNASGFISYELRRMHEFQRNCSYESFDLLFLQYVRTPTVA